MFLHGVGRGPDEPRAVLCLTIASSVCNAFFLPLLSRPSSASITTWWLLLAGQPFSLGVLKMIDPVGFPTLIEYCRSGGMYRLAESECC